MKYIPILIMVMLVLPVHADVYINQILYDPVGPDNHKEWIELAVVEPMSLVNYSLYYSAAREGDPWVSIWDGCDCFVYDYLVIGGNETDADVQSNFLLGNTRGALQLRYNDAVIDKVGYGDAFEGYYWEEPARTVTAGRTLLRTSFTGNNFNDYSSSPKVFHSVHERTFFNVTVANVAPEITVDYELIQGFINATITISDANGDIDSVWYVVENKSYVLTSEQIVGDETNCHWNCTYLIQIPLIETITFHAKDSADNTVSETLHFEMPTLSITLEEMGTLIPGNETIFVVKVAADTQYLIDIVGYISNYEHSFGFNYTAIVSGDELLEIPVQLPEYLSAGSYKGTLITTAQELN
ncbi:MAG: hypothetical protein ACMXYK_05585 [Candidatus Woesearchaeota archaeon]